MKLISVFSVVLLYTLPAKIRAELVTANVTKVQEEDVVHNLTVVSPPAKNNTSENVTAVSAAIKNESNSHSEPSAFPVPKAISVNAAFGGFSAFDLPPAFQLLGNGGLEETFTYQVTKKNKRPFPLPTSINNELDILKEQVRSETYEEIREYVNDLNHQLNTKIRNVSSAFDLITNGAKRNISTINSTLNLLNSEVYNLTILAKETTRSVRALQYVQELDRTASQSQVSNLMGQVETLKREKSEEMRSFMESLSIIQLKLENATKELRVHEAYIRYGQQAMASMKISIEKNDEKITGLQNDGGPQRAEQTVGCGGVIVANSGTIAYKFRQPYSDNERCVWIIRTNRRSKINLQLLEDGFQNQSNSDFLTVTEFAGEDQHPVTLITSSRLEHGNKVIHTFQGPVIFLTFYSDSSIPGTGFILKFDGTGNRTDPASVNAIRYTNLHYTAPTGSFKYPKEGGTYQPNELVAIAINPYNANSVKIHMKTSDLEKDEYCEFDSINFYGSVTGSYALTKRYCHQREEFNGEIIQSSDGIFLVIFRSDASTQFKGFQFAWEAE